MSKTFPELVGQNAQVAAAYLIARGNFFDINLPVPSFISHTILY